MKITKGDWNPQKSLDMEGMRHIYIFCGQHIVCRVDGHKDGLSCGHKAISMDEATINAALIAEAGTVHNDTGFTPRQLAEQKKALLDALKACHESIKLGMLVEVGSGTELRAKAAIAGATN